MQSSNADLLANRSGRLGPDQAKVLRRNYRYLMAGAILALPIVPLVAYFTISSAERGQATVLALVVAVVLVPVVYWIGARPVVEVIRDGRVETIEGTARWSRGSLWVGERRIPVAHGDRPPVADDQRCRAYLVSKGQIRLVGCEAIEDGRAA
jgi:hypothetical protein